MLLKNFNWAWIKYFILILPCFFYSQSGYATCAGLGCSCAVGTTAVTFGNYNPILAPATTANGNVAVTCSALVLFSASYVISLSKGASTTYSPRFMSLAAAHLNYNLYTTAAFASIWGDATGGTVTVSDSYTAVALSVTRNYTVFGEIPSLQTVGAGNYTDTVVVTVTY